VLSDNLVCLEEQIPKSNGYMDIIGEMLELKIKWVTQMLGSNLSLESWIGVKLEGEEF
jgi:hypothetical protein